MAGMQLSSMGDCIRCNTYERLSDDGSKCYRPNCGPREALQQDGRCGKCGAYERAQAGGISCGPPVCLDPRRYVITQLGECRQCPGNEVTSDGTTCRPVVVRPLIIDCASNEVRDGPGCRQCAAYSRPINGRCSADAC